MGVTDMRWPSIRDERMSYAEIVGRLGAERSSRALHYSNQDGSRPVAHLATRTCRATSDVISRNLHCTLGRWHGNPRELQL